MNTVLLLLSVGGFTVYTVAASSDHSQKNQVQNTPRIKPPELLWDPDKRMWTENDDEDFFNKDYSGDENGASDFSFLDNVDNETSTINEVDNTEDKSSNNDFVNSCKSCSVPQDIKQIPTTDPKLTTTPLLHTKLNAESETIDDHIKFENNEPTTIDSPLNQALDASSVKENHGSIVKPNTKLGQSPGNLAIEVNPATDYPLWALEFESKRTKPLEKETIINLPITDQPIAKDDIIGITKLQVIPLEEEAYNDKGSGSKSNTDNESAIFNIIPASKNIPISTPEKPTNLSQIDNHGLKTKSDVDHSDLAPTPVKTNIQEPTATEVMITNQPQHTELSPEVNLPDKEDDTDVDHNNNKVQIPNSNVNSPRNSTLENDNPLSHLGNNNHTINKPLNGSDISTSKPSVNDINLIRPSTQIHLRTCPATVTQLGQTILHWPETAANVTIIPQELCLSDDGTPLTRTCFNGEWSYVNGNCSNSAISTRTAVLHELLNSDLNPGTVTNNLTQITKDVTNVTSYQIHVMSKLLERLADSPGATNVSEIANTVSNIMHYEPTHLKSAQTMLNSTDKILYSLDDFLLSANLGANYYQSIVTDKLVIHKANLHETDFSGFKVSNSLGINRFQNNDLSMLSENTIINASTTNLELALVVSEDLKNTIKDCPGSQANPNIISTIFYNDVLFNNNETQTRTQGKIISVLLPGFNCSFKAPLQIIFKKPNNTNASDRKCAYWQYGSNGNSQNIKGQWIVDTKSKTFPNTTYQLCEFWHVTHFSLLVLGDLAINISEADTKALNIITAVGSGLSLLGLLAVFLTAIAFKSYRSANAVVIHFSVAMAAQIVLLFIANNASEDKLMCIIFGAALHYVVLSQFCWMLTIALLQYKRYVLVFSNPTKYLMTKACAFAWGFPLVPLIVLMSISTDSYSRNSHGLCYAVGNYFIFGVLIPVATIVFINLIVFLRIMIYIASRKIKAHRKMDNATSLQLRLAVMLYFLLGLTWGFGLIAAIGGGTVYSYLFCITATLQGFVLFLFFIALSDKTRSLWGSTLLCPCFEQKRKYDVNTDSSSHPMVRRPTSTNTSDTFTEGTGNDVFQKYKNRKSTDF